MKKDVFIDYNSKVIMFNNRWGYKLVTTKGETFCTRDPLYLPTLKIIGPLRNDIYDNVELSKTQGFDVVYVINGYMTKSKLKSIFPEFCI